MPELALGDQPRHDPHVATGATPAARGDRGRGHASAARGRRRAPACLRRAPADLAPIVAVNTGQEAPDNARVHGLWLSALCPQTGADSTAEERTAPTSFSVVSWSVYVERDSCERWAYADADPALDAPVTGDIPTLLLVGRFDPSNSPAGARLVAGTLTNAIVHEIPDATSNPLGSSECARQLRNAFVDDPSREPDTSCLAVAAPPAFVG